MVDWDSWMAWSSNPIIGLTNTIHNSRDDADSSKTADQQRAENQKNTWDQDRAIVGTEYSSLMTESGAGNDGRALTFQDKFETMDHQQIYAAVRDIDPTLVNSGADGWRALAGQARTAVEEYSTGIEQSITEHWNGQSGAKAIEATRQFATSFTSLAAGFQLVGHGLDLMEGHLAQAKGSVGEPDNLTFGDKLVDALPFQSVVKGPSYRAEEAEEQARYVMITYYRPGAEDVDGRTPKFAEPSSSTDGDGSDKPKTNDPGGPGGTQTPTVPSGSTPQGSTPQGTTEQPTTPQTTDTDPSKSSTPTTPQSTNTDPSKTATPTTPQSANPSVPTANTPGSGVPGSGSPNLGSGVPGSGSPGTGTPSAGRSVPGAGAAGNTASKSNGSNRGTGSSTGRAGTPGMGGAGGGRGKGDEDDEHSTPDYLIYDHGDELLGTQPPALPPGGVIGG